MFSCLPKHMFEYSWGKTINSQLMENVNKDGVCGLEEYLIDVLQLYLLRMFQTGVFIGVH